MNSTQAFKALNGCNVCRTDIEKIVDQAKSENNTDVIFRLSVLLNKFPDEPGFKIDLQEYPQTTALNGAKHTGNYKEALDDCGRLRKGYKFANGTVVKVEPKKPVEKKPTIKHNPKVAKTVLDKAKKAVANVKKEVEKKPEQEYKRVNKPASNYGKKTMRAKKETALFSKEDIPYEVAYRAYTGISFSPEKRAKSEQESYFNFMQEVYDENLKIATKTGKLDIFKTSFSKFKDGYLKRSLDYLRSRHGIFSSMISGGSNFPVAKMEKKNRIANNKLNELIEFGKKGQKYLLQNISDNMDKPIKTGSSTALEQLTQKLAKEQDFHDKTVLYNKIARKKISNEDKENELIKAGFGAKLIDEAKTSNFGTVGSYVTTNSNARIKELKRRIQIENNLKKASEIKGNTDKHYFDGGYILNDYSDNRVKIHFDSKPSEEIRSFLKKSGNNFKWSPFNKVWQRQLNTYWKGARQELYTFLKVNEIPASEKKTQKVDIPTIETFIDLAKKSKNVDEFMEKVRKIKNVPKELSEFWRAKYQVNDGSLYDTSLNFFNEINNVKVNDKTGQISLLKPKRQPKPLKGIVENVAANVIMNTFLGEPEKPVYNSVMPNSNITPIGNNATKPSSFFTVNGETAKFLQQVERKPKHSVVITLDSEQGGGKTTTLYQFINDFATPGNKCLFISAEEHKDSCLATDKRDKYLSPQAIENTHVISDLPKDIEDFYKMIEFYEIIFIDSWQKIIRKYGKIDLDEDVRQRYDGKVFCTIFQQTTTGRAKGGADVVFDGDIIIKIKKHPSFSDNYAYFDKNRYTKIPIENIRYNIASGKCYNPNQPEPSQEQKAVLEGFNFEVK